MKNSLFKRIISVFLAGMIMTSAMPVTSLAEGISEFIPEEELLEFSEEKESNYESGDYECTIFSDGTIAINSYNGLATELTIPSEINGYKVTSIGDYAFADSYNLKIITIPDSITRIGDKAFANCGKLTNISIPDSVTIIGDDAFWLCVRLRSIIIPDSVTSIGDRAFDSCVSLTSITIPNSVTSIGEFAFSDCKSLISINVESDNTMFTSVDGVLFTKDGTTLVSYPCGKTETPYIIPDGVTSISYGAFWGCSSLTSIIIPDSVIIIGNGAFHDCVSLTNISIPDSVIIIGDAAFSDCKNLISITIPNSVTSIGDYAFSWCEGLTSVTIPDSVTSIGDNAFYDCDSLTDVYYEGSEEEWNKVKIGSDNGYLKGARIHFNSIILLPSNISTNNTGEYELITNDGKTITVSSLNNKLHKLESAVFKCGSSQSDLLTTSKVLTAGETINGQSSFTITCEPKGDAENVAQYRLYCGQKLIKADSSNVFTISPSQLVVGSNYYVAVMGKNGTSTKSSILLDVESDKKISSTELKLGGTDGLNFKVGDDFPLLNGLEFSSDFIKFPVSFVATADGTYRVGVNVDNDVMDDDDGWFDFKKDFEEAVKSLNKAKNVGNKSLTDLKKYLKSPSQKKNLILDKEACNVEIAGFGEVSVKADSIQTVELNVIISVDLSYTHKHQFVAWVVPIALEVKIGAKGEFEGIISYNVPNNTLSGSASLEISAYVQPFIGIGVVGVVGAGITGKAELSMQIILLSSTKPSGVEKIDLTGSVGVKAYIGPFEAEYTFLKGTFNLYSRESAQLAQTSTYKESGYTSIYDSEMYTDVSVKKYVSEFVNAEYEKNALSNTLISDVYLAAEPKLASDGINTVMVYLDSDLERGASNQTVLKYSVYNGTEWSAPVQLDDNKTSDWGAEIYNINGEIWTVYQDSETVFEDDITLDSLADSFVIKAAMFDSETGTFGLPVAVSGADGYNHSAVMGTVNKKPAVVWVNNADTEFFGLNATNKIMYSICTEGVWSKPAIYSERLNSVTSLAIDDNSGEMYVAYMIDGDNDLFTTDDVTLYINKSSVVTGSVSSAEVIEIPSVNGRVLSWYNNGNISYYDFAAGEIKNVFDEEIISAVYSVTGDSILYAGMDMEGNDCVYIIKYSDGAWTAPVEAFRADSEITSFSASDDIAVMIDTKMVISDEEISDSSDLEYCFYSEKNDISIDYVDYNNESIEEGEDLLLTVGVFNNSTETVTSVDVAIADFSSVVVETTVACEIAAGESGEIALSMPVYAVDDTEYTIALSNDWDTVTDNNSLTFNLNKTELSVTTKEILNGNKAYLVIDVDNESYISSPATLIIEDINGNILKTITIDNINGKEKYREIIPINELLAEGETSSVIMATISTESEEYYTFNNTVQQYIRATDGDIPYVVVAFMDTEGNEIKSGVYDVYSTVTPPELPEGCDGWIVLGDTTEQFVSSFENIPTDVVFVAKASEKPSSPENVIATAGDGQVTLTWDAVSGAKQYSVYYYIDGKYTNVSTTVKTTSYTVTGLTNGKEYGFLVRAYNGSAWSAFTGTDRVYATPEAATSTKPTNVKATAGDGKVTLTWDAVSGAKQYSVYYYIDGKYTNVSTTVKTTSYTVTGLTNDTEYGFLVRAYNGSEWSEFTSADRVYATPEAATSTKPTNVKATAGDGKVTLTWSPVSGAKQYAVYYYIDGKYTNVSTTVKTTSYTVTGLTNDTEYGFLVRAYNGSEWSAFTSADRVYATPKSSVAAKPTNVKATAGDGKVTLTWSAVSGAKQYAVYYYIDGKYTNVSTTVKTTSYTVTGLTNGKQYGFLVRAYNGSAWSAFTSADRVYATPKSSVAAKPTNVKATAGDGKVTLTWDAVSGAKQYAVYYYIDGKYTNVSTTVKTTSYTVTGLTNGKEYGFLVRAYNGSAWSAFTSADRVYATPEAASTTKPQNVTATAGDGQVTLSWDAVSGATRYVVYYFIDGKYTNVSNKVTDTTFTITGLTNGREYGFLVRAYVNGEWSTYTSDDRVYTTPTA